MARRERRICLVQQDEDDDQLLVSMSIARQPHAFALAMGPPPREADRSGALSKRIAACGMALGASR